MTGKGRSESPFPVYMRYILFRRTTAGFCVKGQKIYGADTDHGIDDPCQPSGAKNELNQIEIKKSDQSPVQSADDANGKSQDI